MAIVEMSKIKLIALNADKENILSTLQKSGCVQLKSTEEKVEGFFAPKSGKEEILQVETRLEKSCEYLTEQVEASEKDGFYPRDYKDNDKNFFVSFNEFNEVAKREKAILNTVSVIEEYKEEQSEIRSEKIKNNNLILSLEPYKDLEESFSTFKDTQRTKIYLGLIKKDGLAKSIEFLSKQESVEYKILSEKETSLLLVIALKENSECVEKNLAENGFMKCPFNYECSAKEKILETQETIKDLEKKEVEIRKNLCGMSGKVKEIKLLADYYSFSYEKASSSEEFAYTSKTFILEGFLPKDKEEEVKQSLYSVTGAVYVDFSKPDKDEDVPTLTKNNPIVRQTEFITDMYSVPNYRELDPSKIVFFFFMLFMGVIMADIGYGILMVIIGVILARKVKVDNGTRRLWYIITIGGVFTILFGVLFNSFFGASLPFIKGVLPNPVEIINNGGNQDGLMVLLLGCLGLGVLQIAVGYFFNALNSFRKGNVADGIFDGIIWVIFFIGFVFAAFNFLVNYLMPNTYQTMNQGVKNFFDMMTKPGIIMVVGSVLVAAVSAGRNEKGFGKFTKGFGAVYGLINLMSDILSYARLFGLMLSGMIIASTFNDMGLKLIAGGGIGYPFGAIVIVVGHVFNIAMNVLGAYIHDSRLQYIEFFSKFYSGEGNKFVPLGSEFKYIYLTK